RTVVLSCIPKGCSLRNVLSQVCGGPLERLAFHDSELPSLELVFIFPEDAYKFYSYCNNTGHFVINGVKVKTDWALGSTTDAKCHQPAISKGLMNEITQLGSRRILIFAQTVPRKVLVSNKKLFYPDPELHFSTCLDIKQIKKEFSHYGEVVYLGPIISRKLSFSVHFSDIRSAIMAKRDCEREGTLMNSKYGQWSIWFARDVTDKPCI
ncbi:uncharacterized protein CANTADRAFT_34702, partial [Suhomyces tanzawaensis NRRL Y-17324]